MKNLQEFDKINRIDHWIIGIATAMLLLAGIYEMGLMVHVLNAILVVCIVAIAAVTTLGALIALSSLVLVGVQGIAFVLSKIRG